MRETAFAALTVLLLTACSGRASFPVRTPPIAPPTWPIQGMTLDQARQVSGFHILEPRYLPSALRLRQVIRSSETSFTLQYANPGSPGNDGGSEFLTLRQDYRPRSPLPPGVPPPAPTPQLFQETVAIHDDRALVLRNYPPPTWLTPASGKAEYISIEWHAQDVYFTIAGSQSLEELVKIAESLE